MRIKKSQLRKLIRESLEISQPLPVHQVAVNGIPLVVEVAADEPSRNRGLMYRESLETNAGMLFVFSDSAPRSFWMKNTYIPLSIAYINERDEIINIEEMIPFNSFGVRSAGNAVCALETNKGWFKKNRIQVGDVVKGIPFKNKRTP